MGMPRDKLSEFLSWGHLIMHGNNESDPDGSIRMAAMREAQTYFAELIAERRANPDPGARDVVSAALSWEIDGQPVSDGEALNCLLMLFMAGLDTVASQSSYA